MQIPALRAKQQQKHKPMMKNYGSYHMWEKTCFKMNKDSSK